MLSLHHWREFTEKQCNLHYSSITLKPGTWQKYLAKNLRQKNFELYYSQHIITVDCSDENGLTIAMNHLLLEWQNLPLQKNDIKKKWFKSWHLAFVYSILLMWRLIFQHAELRWTISTMAVENYACF